MQASHHYQLIRKAILFLSENRKQQPTLEQAAAHVHMSPFHFQRTFSEWAGISPKKFMQYLNLETLKGEVRQTSNLLEAAELTGLSSPSRVYDLFTRIEAVTPQEFKSKGEGISIKYGWHLTPFGKCFIATTERGICSLQFTDADEEQVFREFKSHWQNATIVHDEAATQPLTEQLFEKPLTKQNFKLLLKGTPFQLKVWEALLKIPFGALATYQSIASAIGKDKAMRAVGSAVGKNPVAFLIPCHRVIRSEGLIGNYHWGSDRKTALIGWEKGRLFVKEEKEG